MSLTGRKVLVTGAASGIGRAVLLRCLEEGASALALDRDLGTLQQAVASIDVPGRERVTALEADVAEAEGVAAALSPARSGTEALYGVVNVAGIGGYTGDVGETSLERWERTLSVNLSGVFHVCRAALGLLRANGGGRIVNVSSQFGLVGGAKSPAYAASKAGVIGLTRAMAVDHASEGILVNCVCPGPIDTPMLRASAEAARSDTRESARLAGRSLLGGPGRPEDVAGAVAYLLGADSANVTGAVLAVDGGWTAG